MRVIATQLGYYKDSRRRIGAEFEFAEKDMEQKDGKPVLPSWVVPATDESRAKLGNAAAVERQRGLDGVKAAGGPKRHERQAAKANDDDGSELV